MLVEFRICFRISYNYILERNSNSVKKTHANHTHFLRRPMVQYTQNSQYTQQHSQNPNFIILSTVESDKQFSIGNLR